MVKFNPFGAFVQLDKKVQGLIHISEFTSYENMEKTLEIGKDYNFEILLVEPAEHKMSLRLKK